MFSPSLHQDGPAKGTRSSRRRQRPTSTDSLAQQPRAKRQRLPLSESTFINPDAPLKMYEVKPDRLDILGLKPDGIENLGAPRKELSVRSKKPKAGERMHKGDGSVVLTTNNAYAVSKLPALPDRIRTDAQNRQHGAIYTSTGYAISLSHTHALVWPYTSTTPSPETFVFALPYPSKLASDPLPLGSLVPPSASSDEPGLVVVMPVSGKIAYWESISSAATLNFLREQRVGVEDAINGMLSGEHVNMVINVESVGFVLVFSSGRLAHMNVRDGHGRPAISVQFFRNSPGNHPGGFFGTIRSALTSSGLRGDVVAVRAGPNINIGERVVIAATAKAKLHVWKVHRGSHQQSLADVDIREKAMGAIREVDSLTVDYPDEAFQVIDFTFIPRGLDKKFTGANKLSEALLQSDGLIQHLLLLGAFVTRAETRYSLIEVAIQQEGKYIIGAVQPLKSYTSPIRPTAVEKPRIYLPRPALVAFVVFDRAVVVTSLTSPHLSPEAQLRGDHQLAFASYEDVVDLTEADNIQIIGSGMEEPLQIGADDNRGHRCKIKNPAVTLLVQGVGVVRVSATDIERFATEKPPKVTAKSKLEQAVFFGIKDNNPLVFNGRRVLPFSDKQIANAAIELSNEIVASKTHFISNVPASLENNMRTRLSYLDRLISYVNALNVQLDERAQWILLYNAEKMAVATWVWMRSEEFLTQRPKDESSKNLVAETIMYINEEQKTEPRTDVGEVDPVRHWFIHDVWRLEIFVAWPYQIIKLAWKEQQTAEAGINRLLWEAFVIKNGALDEALKYRQANFERYGLPSAKNEGGQAIPMPWTSSQFITTNLRRLIEFGFEWLRLHWREPNPSIDAELVRQIRTRLPSMIGQLFTLLEDFNRWAEKGDEPRAKQRALEFQEILEKHVPSKILHLKNFDLWDEGIELAKQFKAWDTLAEILVAQISTFQKDVSSRTITASEAKRSLAVSEEKERQMGELMDQYGKDFALQAYKHLLQSIGVQAVLDFPYGKQQFKREFLESDTPVSKVAWMNDVEREDDVAAAASRLMSYGLDKETNAWNKRIELALGKLALLAESEPVQSASEVSLVSHRSVRTEAEEQKKAADLEKLDRELSALQIQEKLRQYIYSFVMEAVDRAAEVELAVKEFSLPLLRKQKGLTLILEAAMSRLLDNEVMNPLTLIDLLTLIHLDQSLIDSLGDQFFLAFKIAHISLKDDALRDAQRLIWRRCLIRDEWKSINETNLKHDSAQLEILGQTAAYHTFFAIVRESYETPSFWPVLKPSECLGVFTDRLDARFTDQREAQRDRIIDAMKWEDKRLRTFVEKHQLDAWCDTCCTEAKQAITAQLHDQTAQGSKAVSDTSSNGLTDVNGRSFWDGGNVMNGGETVSKLLM